MYNVTTTERSEHRNAWYPIMSARLTFAPMGVIKRDVGAIARRLIADSSDDIFPNNDGVALVVRYDNTDDYCSFLCSLAVDELWRSSRGSFDAKVCMVPRSKTGYFLRIISGTSLS